MIKRVNQPAQGAIKTGRHHRYDVGQLTGIVNFKDGRIDRWKAGGVVGFGWGLPQTPSRPMTLATTQVLATPPALPHAWHRGVNST